MPQALMSVAVALVTIALLAAMSLRANRRFEMEPRLPMQWGLDGSVNWSAPRRVALAFMPVMAAICLLGITALTAFVKPRVGQEHLVLPVNVLAAFALVGVHAFHLGLVRRSVEGQR